MMIIWRRSVLFRVAGGLSAMVLAGCSSSSLHRVELMALPTLYEKESASRGEATTSNSQKRILYVTDRARDESGAISAFYSSERDSILRVGSGFVAPVDDSADSTADVSANKVKLELKSVEEIGALLSVLPKGFFTASDAFGDLPPADEKWADLIDQKLADSEQKDIFIYVHGYKVVFENPLLVASEFWHFMGYSGAFIGYAWPSTPKSLAYY